MAKFYTIFPSVVDTGGKFATGVNDTGGKFAAGVNDAGGKLPPVSTTPAAIDTGGKWWEQYQAADTVKWTWRQKFILCFLYYPKVTKQKY